MRNLQISRIMLLIAATLAFGLALPAQTRQVELNSTPNQARLQNNGDLGFDVNFSVGELKITEVQTREGSFDELAIEGWGFSNAVGEPKLPMLRRTIAVPLGAEVRLTLNSQSARELDAATNKLQNRIIPAQEPVSKSADPATLPFIIKSDLYGREEFNSRDWVKVSELGIMRGVRVFALDFYPVRYNPVTNVIRVMENLDVRVDFVNPDLIATADLLARTASWEFEALYAKTLFNWKVEDRTSIVRYPTKYLILCPPNYTDEIQPFVDWKIQQGYAVTVTTVGTGGTIANTSTAIISYMQNLWNSATPENPAPTYLLIIGDTSTSGDNIIANSGATGSHPTDLNYVRLQGTDYVPEMYYGRFSVSSATELSNIVNKTLNFEKTQMSDLSYLGNVVMIAGVDGTFGPTHGNGAINYGTTEYFNAVHGITSNTYLYPASGSSDSQIIANANEGRGYINYTAHGNETSWGDPTFTVTNVNAMTNAGKYGVMVGNCCLTNKFDYGVCFGEAIIRKANAAGVIYIGGTNSTYWDEDYWWAVGAKGTANGSAPAYDATKLGVYDAYFHDHSEAFTDWAQTTGETIWMGNLAVSQGGSSRINYYWEIYSIMGDPSLMPYFGVPTANTATYPAQIMIGNTSYAISGAAPYTRIGLSMNGVIYGTGITDASGNLTLTISPFTTAGTAKLVLTAQNRITNIVDIPVVAAEGPYMSVDSVLYDDANNDAPDYNESGYLDVTFENVGVDPATSVSAVLSCATPGVTITDANHSIASLAAGASVLADNAYAITIANNVANGTVANFTITMTMSGESPWTHNFTLNLNAPALAFGAMSVSDPTGNNNGRLDPGETVTITIALLNAGGAASPSGTATLSCANPGITVNTGTSNFGAIAASGSTNLSFSLTADAGMTVGTVAALVFNANASAYSANKNENVAVGLIIEDFSSGDFSSYPWLMGSTPWVIVSDNYHSASYAARSGIIYANGSTTMETTRVLSSPGDLSFWYKVSSESGWDYLRFYVDGTVQGQWSGTVDWTQASYNLAAGTRVLKWEYVKDGSVDNGYDCAWVDDIIFPASTTPSSFYPPQNLSAEAGNGYVELSWDAPVFGTPTGYQIHRDGSLLTTVTGPTYTDNAVVNETTYSYYLIAVYSGGVSDPTDTVQATPSAIVPTEVIIGDGTSSNGTSTACPINVYYQSLHGQAVYTAAEFIAAGVVGPIEITQIGFNITGLPTLAMPNYLIRMGHTTATDVSNWIPAADLTQVWSSASYLPTTTGWKMYTLSTPFLWNGTDNIVIDTAYGLIGSYTSSGTTQYTTVTSGYRYVRNDYNDQTSVFTGGSTSSYRPNLKLALLPNQTGPEISISPLSLDYGDVPVNDTETQQFIIQNTGNEALSGNITTPAGYTVAAAVRNISGIRSSRGGQKNRRNTIGYSVATNSQQTFDLSFAPTAATAYNETVAISSNDADEPVTNIMVSGNGYMPNTAPEIDLPASFDFDKNGSLTVNFSSYVYDADNDPLALGYSGNTNISVEVTGLNVTFTAAQNWTGSETHTFTVTDGASSALDVVEVTVNPVAMPDWAVVTYPNNSATVFGEVSLYGLPCELNDVVGAFVGDECRGMAEIVIDNSVAYVTLIVNLAASGETVSFRIFDYSSGSINQAQTTVELDFGETAGTTEIPVPINVTSGQTQTIALTTGWNLVSSRVIPADPDLMAVFDALITAETLVKVQDEGGNAMLQSTGDVWQNGIGDMAITEGYYVQVNADCILEITGAPVSLPMTVALDAGWNIVSYPHSEPQSAASVLAELMNSGLLVKVQNDSGEAIVQATGGSWNYGFSTFEPGEAYYVNVSGETTLDYGSVAKSRLRTTGSNPRLNRF